MLTLDNNYEVILLIFVICATSRSLL